MDVVSRTRAHDAFRWTAVGVLAVVALVCSFLPAALLEVSGFLGAGETQRVYDLQREFAFVPDLLPRSLVVVLPAVALLGTAAAGLVYGSRRWVAVIAFAAGLTLAAACYRVETHFTFIEQGAMSAATRRAPASSSSRLPATCATTCGHTSGTPTGLRAHRRRRRLQREAARCLVGLARLRPHARAPRRLCVRPPRHLAVARHRARCGGRLPGPRLALPTRPQPIGVRPGHADKGTETEPVA